MGSMRTAPTPSPVILNVDDDATHRYIVAKILKGAGYNVVEASTGKDALELARRHKPDLIVLDIKLPDIDGLEVCERLKLDPETCQTYVLHLSGSYGLFKDRLKKAEDGAESFLLKPVEPETLVASVRGLLRLRQAQQALRTSEELLRTIINSLPGRVAAIDDRGNVFAANQPWLDSRATACPSSFPAVPLGESLFKACDAAAGSGLPQAKTVGEGVSAILDGQRSNFEMEYACASKSDETWYRVHATPLKLSASQGAVVVHEDITVFKRAQKAEAEFVTLNALLAQRERELAALLDLSPALETGAPLARSLPEKFQDWTREYQSCLDTAVERRTYKVNRDISSTLRALASRLALAEAGPRDVIDMHSAALKNRAVGVPPEKASVFAEEGRYVLLELMGLLAVNYRNRSSAQGKK